MKILVTGGAGLYRRYGDRLLLARGHSATVFDNLCIASHSWLMEQCL
jgi:UDP-glucose 4-epimerase